jgi:hypothetical protein
VIRWYLELTNSVEGAAIMAVERRLEEELEKEAEEEGPE